jgi:hypothetical protein
MQINRFQRMEVRKIIIQIDQIIMGKINQGEILAVEHDRVHDRVEVGSFEGADLVVG